MNKKNVQSTGLSCKQYLLLSGKVKKQRSLIGGACKRCFVLLAILFFSQAQLEAQHVLKGLVLDQQNKPLTGASVLLKSTSIGTTTDIDGKFILEIANPQDTLIVTYQGYIPVRLLAGTEREKTIILNEDLEQSKMNEVVVVGFGTQKKLTVTGAVSSISTKEIEQFATPS
ncbi:MAG TPA: carboxypeptidase-like regulatory domain-containing protein, partial [Niabella sp.]|nr:carboxypeptidase-like regulatory domain-containing protein [Niabella sp.]